MELADPEEEDDELAREMMDEKSRPMPGQLENCEKCGKRFTVTAYSKTGPNGGLLCAKCSKEVADDAKKSAPKKRGPRSNRRQAQSKLLDGIIQYGAMSLVEMCTKVGLYIYIYIIAGILTIRLRKLPRTSTMWRNLEICHRRCFIVSARSCPRDVFSRRGH